jgi:ribonuclease R
MRPTLYKPMTFEELKEALNVPDEDIQKFRDILQEMEKNGEVILTRSKRYGLPERMNLFVGILQGHPKGFGFVLSERPGEDDVYVALEDMNGAMHNDRVVVRLHGKASRDKKRQGEVIRILHRANQKIVGTYESSQHFAFVVPDEKRIFHDIFIPKTEANGALDGEKVVVEILRWPEKRRNPEGRVIERLGDKHDPGTDILSLIRRHNLPEDFPEEVWREVESIPAKVRSEDWEGRLDLRALKMVTIDGEDAKDLDDAVSVERLENGNYRLGVHIADVSYYVREGSALDREAQLRGTSVYLVDRVIPMLPPQLSNGICSLNAGEERLALSVFMEIDPEGKVVNHSIHESVILVKRRMTYTKVRKILEDRDPELMKEYEEFLDDFELMRELCLILRASRMEKGSIDFNFPETKVKLDEQGKPIAIVPVVRSIAEMIIEEFMLVCNKTVAEHLSWLEVPLIYRIHEEPDEEKLYSLNEFLHNFGYHIKGIGKIHPRALQKVIQEIEGKAEERIINTVILRSLKQAVYSDINVGHFALAFEHYVHFTSPIRRYPDLVVHRITKEALFKGMLSEERLNKLRKTLPAIALNSSERERLAAEAERESVDLKKVEFMLDKVGMIFPGYISGVAQFGIFVELENLVEGLVHVSNMTDDYYTYYENQYALIGERTKKIYRLGDPVKVQVIKVNVDERQIDFILAN